MAAYIYKIIDRLFAGGIEPQSHIANLSNRLSVVNSNDKIQVVMCISHQ